MRDIMPVALVLLLDMSASMAGEHPRVQQAALRFVDALLPDDRVRVGTFGDEIALSPWLTSDKDVLRRVLRASGAYLRKETDMRRLLSIVALTVVAAGLTGRPVLSERSESKVAQTPPAPPTYDVKVELNETSTGTTTFIVDQAGKVTGTMHLDDPNLVDATLGGTVKDGVWTFNYPFSMSAQACSGTATGTAKISADQATVTGTLTVSGGCTSQPQTGTFTFTKRPK